jgi:hypothetical protein
LVFEFVFFFLSLFALGLWLFAGDTYADGRRWYRARRVGKLLRALEGRDVARAQNALGRPSEVIHGSGGRSLYVWKDYAPGALPGASTLLIITLTVDGAGLVTHAGWEER